MDTSATQALKERVKELTCLYNLTTVLAENSEKIEIILERVCDIVQAAWKHPDYAVVELHLQDLYCKTSEIPAMTVFQESEITVDESCTGSIKVHYPSTLFDLSNFLPEEKKLLDKVALEIGSYYDKRQQKMEKEKLERTVERNDRLTILGEITAGIAHELNTPLGNILGFAELIQDRTENKQIKEDAAKIIKAAIYSREVVKKLMFFSCEMPQNRKVCLIAPLVSEALTLLGPNFRKARVQCTLDIRAPKVEAQIDPIQFTQVLFNLLINALHASPVDSTVRLVVDKIEDQLSVAIIDQGVGIKEEHLTRIFEPFFTTRPLGEGSGLGLSVVHGIVKSHKGRILVSKNVPKGIIFEILIPASL